MSLARPQWLRLTVVAGLLIGIAGMGWAAYRHATKPVMLAVAAGSADGEAARLMTEIATRLRTIRSHVRLKVVETASPLEAAQALAAGKVNLAVVRGDSGDLADARAVVHAADAVVLIVVPAGSSIESVDDLRGKTIGVASGALNHGIVELLTKEYNLPRSQFVDLDLSELRRAIETKQVNALLVVMPITDQNLARLRELFPSKKKQNPDLIAIESAGALAAVARAYESYELPKGTLRGSPPIPDEDLTTLRVPLYLIADKKLNNDTVSELAKAIMETRRHLMPEFPMAAQISAPETDKDALIPVHPGAAAYFDGEQQSFFDRYGDALFYGSMLLGGLTTAFAALWKFMGRGAGVEFKHPLHALFAMTDRIREARSECDLDTIEENVDSMLKEQLTKPSTGDADGAAEWAALSMATLRLSNLVQNRRNTLAAQMAPRHPEQPEPLTTAKLTMGSEFGGVTRTSPVVLCEVCRLPQIDRVCPAFEGNGKTAERHFEHRAHEQAQGPAPELVRNEEFHFAGSLAGCMKGPAVFQPAERAFQIFDQDLEIGPVERHPAGKGFANELVCDRHVCDQDLDPLRLWDALANLELTAQWYEFGIVLHVGDEIEHVGG